MLQPLLKKIAELGRILPGQGISIIVADPGEVDVGQENVQPWFGRIPVDAEFVGAAVVAIFTPVAGVKPGRCRCGLMLIHAITSGAIIPCLASHFPGGER